MKVICLGSHLSEQDYSTGIQRLDYRRRRRGPHSGANVLCAKKFDQIFLQCCQWGDERPCEASADTVSGDPHQLEWKLEKVHGSKRPIRGQNITRIIQVMGNYVYTFSMEPSSISVCSFCDTR